MIPRPDSLESFMLLFPFGLESKAVGDRRICLQFYFSDEVSDRDRWTIPGGWADVNDTPTQSVVREVFEESGF